MKKLYACTKCGSNYPKWVGKCEDCGEWGTVHEEAALPPPPKPFAASRSARGSLLEVSKLGESVNEIARLQTGISEFDRVLGGGLVTGSVILLGGDPGIGKSTLLLQLVKVLGDQNCLYVSGEESIDQLHLRARRLGILNEDAAAIGTLTKGPNVVSATFLPDILCTIEQLLPGVVIIDSIQTMYHDAISSAPGTVSQVRASAFELISLAKRRGIVLILVGHVTKEGQLAGPKVLEHMVDTVLYFESERGNHFRIIRAVKNRYGAANELGFFEMVQNGLSEVTNASAMFLSNHHAEVSGAAIFGGFEGTRAVLLEIQALITPSYLASPRRAVVGWDTGRLAMLIAVLNSRYSLNLLDKEVYLNVVGGLKVNETGADLAVMAALISAAYDVLLDQHTIFFGEIGLSGEVRRVTQMEARLQEAEKLGFTCAVLPNVEVKYVGNIKMVKISTVGELIDFIHQRRDRKRIRATS
jgi:DNA repair protein RadA/Sms